VKSPQARDLVCVERVIGTHKRHFFNFGLGSNQAVKRVSVMKRHGRNQCRMFNRNIQQFDAVFGELFRDEASNGSLRVSLSMLTLMAISHKLATLK